MQACYELFGLYNSALEKTLNDQLKSSGNLSNQDCIDYILSGYDKLEQLDFYQGVIQRDILELQHANEILRLLFEWHRFYNPNSVQCKSTIPRD